MKTFSLVNAPHLPVTGESHPLIQESTRWLTTGNAVALLGAMLVFGGLYAWSQMNPAQAVIVPPMVTNPTIINPGPDIMPKNPTYGVAPKVDTKGVYEPAPDAIPSDDDAVAGPGSTPGVPGDLGPITDDPFDMPGFMPPTQTADTLFAFDELPQLLSIHAPVYPELVRQAGIDGTVLVKVFVTRAGKVKQAVAMDGPEALWDAAVAATKTALFAPAKQGDNPVDVWVMIPVTFTLNR